MTWKDELNRQERAELDKAESKRDEARDAYNAVRLKLKTRADARLRRKRGRSDG